MAEGLPTLYMLSLLCGVSCVLYVKWSGGSLFRCLLVDSFDLYVKGLGGNLSRVVFRSLGFNFANR